MQLLYKGELMPEGELRLPLTNRAFQYNDGFFETMIAIQGRIRFWPDHVDRMQEACSALGLEWMDLRSPDNLHDQLLQLVHTNDASAYARIKVKVWRSGAGLYTPQTDEADGLATAHPAVSAATAALRIGICQHTRTAPSPFSHFKGPNALIYVMASREKAGTGYDDMLLCSPTGAVAELLSSNLFWLQQGTLYTPALRTGCVNGILRRNILRKTAEKGIPVVEIEAPVQTLFAADSVFAANVTGIKVLESLDGRRFPVNHPVVEQLQQAIFS